MADLTRAEDLVQTMERDDTFRAEVEAAPTVTAKRAVLDAHGYQDVGLNDMRAYVESKGGKLVVPDGGQELSENELAAVAGGAGEYTQGEQIGIGIATGGIIVATGSIVVAGASAAAG